MKYVTIHLRLFAWSYLWSLPAVLPPTSPVNFLDQTQHKALAVAVFGLVFSKLSVLVLAPDPLPFSKDTPQEIKGVQLCPCPIKTS
jgi:hypothetical protein